MNYKYNSLLKTDEWKRFRKAVVKADGCECVRCGATGKLNVHHMKYIRKDGELVKPWEYPVEYVCTLCDECHRQFHEARKINDVWFNILAMKRFGRYALNQEHKECVITLRDILPKVQKIIDNNFNGIPNGKPIEIIER